MTTEEICRKIDTEDQLKQFKRKKRAWTPYNRFASKMIHELVTKQRLPFEEAMQAIAGQWNSLSDAEKAEFKVPDKKEREIQKLQRKVGTKVKIKNSQHSLMDGLQLNGFVYFAQLMRHKKTKEREVER